MAHSSARRLWAHVLITATLAACAASPAPVATIAPAALTPSNALATTPTLAPGQIMVRDFITKALAENGITLLDMESRLAERSLSVYISAKDANDPQPSAEFAMGVLLNAVSLSSDPAARPQVLSVMYHTSAGKLNRMTLTEPTISQLIAGQIELSEAVKRIKFEVTQ